RRLLAATPSTRRSTPAANHAGCPTGSGVSCLPSHDDRPRIPRRGPERPVNALVTGVAGFIGSTLADRLIPSGGTVIGIDCFTDYYPRVLKERNLSALLAHPRFRFVESTIQAADLPSLLANTTHVFHLAAQAGVRKSWGRDFTVYTVNNIEATQVLLEACVGR